MSQPPLIVLNLFLSAPARHDWYGLGIVRDTGLGSGCVTQTLFRLEQWGWVEASWEDEVAALADGRPPRRFYQLTEEGEQAARDLVANRGNGRNGISTRPDLSGQHVAYSVAYDFAGAAGRARALARRIERSADRADVGAAVHWLVSDVDRVANAAMEIADGLEYSRAIRCKAVFHTAIHRARALNTDLRHDFNLEINRAVAIDHVRASRGHWATVSVRRFASPGRWRRDQ